MKYLTLVLLFILPAILFGQQTDDNTLVINEYFNVENDNQIAKNSTLQNLNSQSYVQLIQTGNENSIYVNSLQKGDNQIVNQVGNQNNYEYYNYYSTENSTIKVNQEGTLNSLQIFGENALMKNAIINQKSKFKSVVIKNYTN
jgi:Ca2+-binding RTX toxin-like protein